MVEISHHSQIDSPWLRNYTTDHFPALISHFPDHWLHYVKAIITLIFCCKCSRSQLNIFRRLKMFSDALAKSGETRWSHLRDYVEKSNQRHWHMSAGWIILNMVLYETLVMDIWSEAVVKVWHLFNLWKHEYLTYSFRLDTVQWFREWTIDHWHRLVCSALKAFAFIFSRARIKC